ncbi:MAG TPA: hypothetical protein VFG52_03995 [Xanthomonadales bacterium]|nr:hypothetical protein [Xanthomonadales bacterium]
MSIQKIACALLFLLSSSLAAQQAPAPAPRFCQDHAGFGDWDFWVGEWDVFSNDEARTLYGHNSITKHYENCLIKETWESAGGGGFSVNYYNPVKQQWRQVWVANGYSIDYTGGLNDQGQMVLEGEIYNYQPNTTSPFRGSWSPEENGDVIQRFEVFNADTQSWDVWFEGRYVKK